MRQVHDVPPAIFIEKMNDLGIGMYYSITLPKAGYFVQEAQTIVRNCMLMTGKEFRIETTEEEGSEWVNVSITRFR